MESRVSSDEDLKLSELLRYYMLNIDAAKVRTFLCEAYFYGIVTQLSLCFEKIGREILVSLKKLGAFE